MESDALELRGTSTKNNFPPILIIPNFTNGDRMPFAKAFGRYEK
jgi:hypothetical protein